MSEAILGLVDAIKAGDAVATETAFGAAMAEKLGAQIDDYRQTVAANMFAVATATPTEEQQSEE